MKIKGFDKNLCCRGYQYEIGKEYKIETDKPLKLCSESVFHYADSLQNVHRFYSCTDDNRYCEIEVLGEEITDGGICGSNHIKILREIKGGELNTLKGLINGNTGLFNSGCHNVGNYNSGDFNSGDFNSGDYNAGDYNSGYKNTGFRNSGDFNVGSFNSGWHNAGYYNTGDGNSGYCNTGDGNSGDYNVGHCNSSDFSVGDFNACDYSDGVFCTAENPNIRLFNKDSGLSYRQFTQSKWYTALRSAPFPLTEWDDKNKKLITHTYKEACAMWWDGLTDENKEIIKTIPNFDPEIFREITGIEV